MTGVELVALVAAPLVALIVPLFAWAVGSAGIERIGS